MDVESILKNKRPNREKLLSFGFSFDGTCFSKRFPISEGFEVLVKIDSERADYFVFDGTGEEYYLARVKEASGPFVSAVKKEIEEIIKSVAKECFDDDVYQMSQTKRILRYIETRYAQKPEFLWEKFPEFAAIKTPKKTWFALIGKIERGKLEKGAEGAFEILNLKNQKEKIASLLEAKVTLPAYHMNKKSWMTIPLDDRLFDEEIFPLIDESYSLALKK